MTLTSIIENCIENCIDKGVGGTEVFSLERAFQAKGMCKAMEAQNMEHTV